MSTVYLITGFSFLTLIIASVFFYISGKTKDRSVLYWGLCWVFYSASLFCFLVSFNGGDSRFLEIKKIFDMYSILCILFGIYHFTHLKIPGFWLRFSIYLAIWVGLAVYFEIDQLSTTAPVFLFDIMAVLTLCYTIYRYWVRGVTIKTFYILIFLIWGLAKAFLALYELRFDSSPNVYIAEILLANLLNVFIFLIYLDRMRDELTQTEERFKIIVENSTDAIFYFTFEPKPAFLYITPSVEDITGFSPQTFYRDPMTILALVPEEKLEMMNRLFFSGPDSSETSSDTFMMQHNRRGIIWIDLGVSQIKEGNRVVALEGVIRDVTHIKSVEQDLITSKNSRDLLLSYISHELKTPLTSILGYITAMRDGTISNSEERDKAMDIISQKSQILERMVHDLFQLSQLETNQYSFNFSMMDCFELCKYIEENNLPELKNSGMSYKVQLDREGLEGETLIADYLRINQVVSNIIVNAIKHKRKGGTLNIKFHGDQKTKQLIMDISDNGTGIPKDDLPHIFERFYRSSTSPSSQAPGRGLGLTLSKEIVEAHHGTITAKSTYGRGSTFTVALPLFEETEGEF
jgi:PAS domain S-box-containing protein